MPDSKFGSPLTSAQSSERSICFLKNNSVEQMPKGGARIGAGRKPGQQGRRTIARIQLAQKAALQGITPLEVMLNTMRHLVIQGKSVEASAIARDAAPYVHPRLSAVDQKLSGDLNIGRLDAPKSETREEWLARRNKEKADLVAASAAAAAVSEDVHETGSIH